MTRAPPKRFTSWSNTRLSDYALCPLKAKLKHLDKVPDLKPGEKPSPALEHGREAHLAAEAYLKGIGRTVPRDLLRQAALFKRLRARRLKEPKAVSVEGSMAFRRDWSPTTFDDWAGCWLRIKVDAFEITGDKISVYDWKSGRFRPNSVAEYEKQLDLYALGTMITYSGATVHPMLVYIDAPAPVEPYGKRVYTPKEIPALKKRWETKVRPMMNDTRFAAKPNSLCGWCPYRAERGGPCLM